MTTSPFSIQLSADKKNTLSATLKNISGVTHTYLHENRVHPSELVLTTGSGEVVESFDSRSIQKFDNTVYLEMFKVLEPGKEIVLYKAKPQKNKNKTFTLRWLCYEFDDLPPGTYTAQVIWKSEGSEKVWKGEIQSNVVTLKLLR